MIQRTLEEFNPHLPRVATRGKRGRTKGRQSTPFQSQSN
ncbi:MAG: hypothetical protein ACI8YQ_002367 [Polaribacter sp.]|jgi:hypothetical protein